MDAATDTVAAIRPAAAIMVTNRGEGDIVGCIRTLERDLVAGFYGIVVVDSASTDGTVAPAQAAAGWAEVHGLARNVGFGAARNRGAARVPRHDVLLVNPDCEMQQRGTVAEAADHSSRSSRRPVWGRVARRA